MPIRKPLRDLPYRWKLLLTMLAVVLIVVAVMSLLMFWTAARQSASSNLETLNLFTEQTLTSFAANVRTVERSAFTQYMASGAPTQLPRLRGLKEDSPAFLAAAREVTGALARMITAGGFFSHAALRMDDTGICIDSGAADPQAVADSRWLFSQEKYIENQYNFCQWCRMDDGSLWVVRDVYNPSPLRHMGRIALRVRQDMLIPALQDVGGYEGQVLLYGKDGALMTATDPASAVLDVSNDLLRAQGEDYRISGGKTYAVARVTREGYTAVGLLPRERVQSVRISVFASTALAAALGIVLGVLSAWMISRSLTRQMNALVRSMDQVAAGRLDVVTPVESRDEVGILTEQFNSMTAKTRELLDRLVKEEQHKRQAEFQNLEYQYRFLQWQINPHFIYNALEVVNAMAKIDGDDELSRMVIELSAYFRQNARSIERRFVTIREEFESLGHYAEIYRSIYGSTYSVTFDSEGGTADAYVPTMILQPLLENSLVHGRNTEGDANIRVSSGEADGQLVIRLEDDGPGMSEETIRLLLSPDRHEERRDHLGIRNVLERLHLLFGDSAQLSIHCPPAGGTVMEMKMPANYERPAEGLFIGKNTESADRQDG